MPKDIVKPIVRTVILTTLEIIPVNSSLLDSSVAFFSIYETILLLISFERIKVSTITHIAIKNFVKLSREKNVKIKFVCSFPVSTAELLVLKSCAAKEIGESNSNIVKYAIHTNLILLISTKKDIY
jgi:hypothetical protein